MSFLQAPGQTLTRGQEQLWASLRLAGDHRRDIHIGVGVGGPVGTPVHAFADGKIHSLGYNAAALDYGNVIVTEHVVNGKRIWALQGHLSAQSIEGKRQAIVSSKESVLGGLVTLMRTVGGHRTCTFS